MILALGVAPAAAAPNGGASAKSNIAMSGMDCCPPDQPLTPGCQKNCPFVALCMAKCFSVAALEAARIARVEVAGNVLPPAPHQTGRDRTIRPPAPPPRIQDMAGA